MAPTGGYPAAGGTPRQTRAADTDRERVAGLLNTAFVEGRLSREDYDSRLSTALGATTYADLDRVVADLPVAPRPSVPVVPAAAGRTSPLAIASLVCGLAQVVLGPLPTIPAIVFGHVARSQIRRSGEQGAGMALAGLILGWVVVGIIVAALILGFAVASGAHGSSVPAQPVP